jgi:hypothetical protein
MLDWDKVGVCRFAALQSPAGRALLQRAGRAPDDISSIVLVEERASHVKWAARLTACLLAPACLPDLPTALCAARCISFALLSRPAPAICGRHACDNQQLAHMAQHPPRAAARR